MTPKPHTYLYIDIVSHVRHCEGIICASMYIYSRMSRWNVDWSPDRCARTIPERHYESVMSTLMHIYSRNGGVPVIFSCIDNMFLISVLELTKRDYVEMAHVFWPRSRVMHTASCIYDFKHPFRRRSSTSVDVPSAVNVH